MSLPAETKHRDLVAGLRLFGYDGPHSTKGASRHPLFMRKGTFTLHIPNPGAVSQYVLADVLRKAEISHDEWNKATQKRKGASRGEGSTVGTHKGDDKK